MKKSLQNLFLFCLITTAYPMSIEAKVHSKIKKYPKQYPKQYQQSPKSLKGAMNLLSSSKEDFLIKIALEIQLFSKLSEIEIEKKNNLHLGYYLSRVENKLIHLTKILQNENKSLEAYEFSQDELSSVNLKFAKIYLKIARDAARTIHQGQFIREVTGYVYTTENQQRHFIPLNESDMSRYYLLNLRRNLRPPLVGMDALYQTVKRVRASLNRAGKRPEEIYSSEFELESLDRMDYFYLAKETLKQVGKSNTSLLFTEFYPLVKLAKRNLKDFALTEEQVMALQSLDSLHERKTAAKRS